MISYKILDVCDIYQPKTIATKDFVPSAKYTVYGANGAIGYYDKYNHEEAEVLMACRGATCGSINISKPFSWINGNAMVVHPNGKVPISKKFLAHYLSHIDKKAIISGTAQPQITRNNLKTLDIIVPPLPEQERIGARIEELFSELDKAVETLQKTKQQLAVYRQAVLKEAFEGEWDKDCAQNLCDFITKGTTPHKTDMSKNNAGIPFIKVYNLTFSTVLDFTVDPTFISKDVHHDFLSRSIVLPGDVLMNIVGPPMGKVSIVPDTYPEWNINQAIVRFRCRERLNNRFLAYYLSFSETVESMKKKSKATAGQFNLTLEICRNLQIPVPPMEKQKEIVQLIESRLSVCDSIEQTVDTALAQAEALRQSILKEAFEGRLV